MIKQILKVRDFLVWCKVYLMRVLAYLSLFNACMILFLTLGDLKQYGIEINLTKWFAPIIILGTILLVVAGWLDDKMGLFKKENQIRSHRTPQFNELLKQNRDILKNQEEIKERIKRLEK